LPESAEAWQTAAARHEGSWWTDWHKWISERNGTERVAARAPGAGRLKPIEDAPGSYVKERVEAKKHPQA
jgi:polyhydroxyalkanoate synthase